jgi:hypothetical protein
MDDEQKRIQFQCKKIYCGDKEELPEGYHVFGTRSQCLRRGFGVSSFLQKKKQAEEQGIDVNVFLANEKRQKHECKVERKIERVRSTEESRAEGDGSEMKDEPIERKLRRESRNFLEDNIDSVMRDNPNIKYIDEMFSTLALLAQKYLYYK